MHGYSLHNAERFGWSSVSGDLNEERRLLLERELVGHTVLDAGCGGGAYVAYLARGGARAVGLERHREFLGIRSTSDGTFVQGDVARLPFADAAFDSTFCFDVLEHLVDDALAVRELARVSRKRLLLAVPRTDDFFGGHGITFGHYQDPTHERTYTADSLSALLKENLPGFPCRVVEELHVGARRLAKRLLMPRGRPAGLFDRVARSAALRLIDRVPVDDIATGLVAVVELDRRDPATS